MSDVESEAGQSKRDPLLGKKQPKASTSRRKDQGCLAELTAMCCSLVASLIVLAIFNMVSIAAIVIGSLYYDASFCPGSPHLAMTLIISGALALVLSIFEGRVRYQATEEGHDSEDFKYACLNLLRLIKFIVFVYLCVQVLSTYKVLEVDQETADLGATSNADAEIVKREVAGNDTAVAAVAANAVAGTADAAAVVTPAVSHYCHPTLFFFAFWVVLIVIVFGAISILMACCVCCVAALFAAAD